ncbi:tRNA lysidine(34) synthetase TilS [Phormidesmis priestleyi ULC007]|uniref:tRNA(Ile)-lysidine synthase n=1 Tax=Phormidesmis priestleyi ULC007 TaxID=1920490 RepID=A0A2T1DHH3_9CYAN|nr:tRNA lysidine(34) synthetase TilS [Phormidesmis priestleyi]PSB19917.1 tRNA lysidine(34) synthetase TilS [Phormidesmis priestleyi ULC007]PZO50385.1 MAG: tRNA lysidine(34) synthetase TilS [Phormidesmis priestleyi]
MSRNWTPLHDRLHRTLKERNLLEKGERLLVAVSGGQDSLCLVKLLLDLQPKWNWQIAIVHCDHRWRSDSQQNAEFVAKLANAWQVSFYLEIANQIPASEADARQWRYDCFQKIAELDDYKTIVTGHTASDRAETLLYNLIRGSGADGLQALVWKRSLLPTLNLVRPLLEITRAETAQFCQASDLQIWEDTTNQDLTYARNRIRQELLPYLQTHFNPQAEQNLAQTAELLTAEVEYLEKIASELRESATSVDRLALNRSKLRSIHLALQRRVIRQFLQQALTVSPNFEQIEKMTALINAPNRSRTDPFPGGAIAEVEGDWIRLKTPSPQM